MISLNGFLVFLTSNALIESKYWSWNVDAGFSPCQVRLNLWLMTRRSLREMCIQLEVFRCIWLARHWDVNHSEWSLKEKNVNIWSGHSTNMWSCVLLTTYSLLSLSIITAFCKISGMQCILCLWTFSKLFWLLKYSCFLPNQFGYSGHPNDAQGSWRAIKKSKAEKNIVYLI